MRQKPVLQTVYKHKKDEAVVVGRSTQQFASEF